MKEFLFVVLIGMMNIYGGCADSCIECSTNFYDVCASYTEEESGNVVDTCDRLTEVEMTTWAEIQQNGLSASELMSFSVTPPIDTELDSVICSPLDSVLYYIEKKFNCQETEL